MADLCCLVQRAKVEQARCARRGPKRIADVLGQVLAKRGYAQLHNADAAAQAWASAAPPLAAKVTRVGALRRGVLEIMVPHSSLVQELTFEKPALLAKIQAAWPTGNVRDLRFRSG